MRATLFWFTLIVWLPASGKQIAGLFTYDHQALTYKMAPVDQFNRAIENGTDWSDLLSATNPLMQVFDFTDPPDKPASKSYGYAHVLGFILGILSIPGWLTFAIILLSSKNQAFKKALKRGFIGGIVVLTLLAVIIIPSGMEDMKTNLDNWLVKILI